MIELTKIEKQNDMEVMKKKLCIIMSAMLLMLAGTVMTACSDDEEVLGWVSFNIIHEYGGESLEFETEEPLVFQLIYSLRGNPILSQDLKKGDLIADQNLFTIYREDGEKVGQPQLDRIGFSAFETAVGPYVFSYKWSTQDGDAKLEPGNYYTQFSIMYNTNVGGSGHMERKNYKVNFKIK